MASIAPKAPPTKPRKEREREKDRERKEKANQHSTERLKTVVRRLPPNLPEDIFWQSVQQWVSDDTVTWKAYYAGKLRKKLNKENIPSRAYIAFKNDEQLASFSREYDGHIFRDKAGNESQAVVEFAPYQKVPGEKKKPDARNATIEKDEDYISFLESLNTTKEPVTLEALIAATRPASPPKTTPLLEALKAEKTANKDKEAILRNHAHYKDQVNVLRNKDDAKKKGMSGPTSQKPAGVESPAAPAGSKKAAKKAAAAAPAGSGQSQPRNVKQVPPPAKSAAPAAPASNGPQKPSRPPRGGRQTAQVKPSAAPTILSAPAAVPTAAGTAAGATSALPVDAPSRRARPVIGLASRQFEAALSGVGVAAGGERKSRREREREREREKDSALAVTGSNGAPASSAFPSDSGNGTDNKPAPPSSPKRERGGRRGGAGSGNPASVSSGGAKLTDSPVIKVPNILQRIDAPPAILKREPSKTDESMNTTQTIATPVTNNASSNPIGQSPIPGGGRGGRRGRGRGRGVASGANPRGG